MTRTYESIDHSETSDTVYTPIEKPEPEYEKVDTVVPVSDEYLMPTPLYSN